MLKTRGRLAVLVGVFCVRAAAAQAQQLGPEGTYFVRVGFGAQLQEGEFGSSSTFQSFGETGSIETVQNIARGAMLDIAAGYQFSPRWGLAISLWGAQANGAAAATVTLPDELFFNRFATIGLTTDDLPQQLVGMNFEILLRQGITSRVDVTLSIGPTLIYTKQKVGVVTIAANSSTATLGRRTESAVTAKSGNAGIDINVRVRGDYGVGVFARYAGGETDLPSAPKLRVGGTQIGGNMRWRF